jgi:hypothetical protein
MLLPTENERGRQDWRLALLFPSFEEGVSARKTKALADDITSERQKDFGASAPVTSPQKTGFAHSPATASEAKAAFILNG